MGIQTIQHALPFPHSRSFAQDASPSPDFLFPLPRLVVGEAFFCPLSHNSPWERARVRVTDTPQVTPTALAQRETRDSTLQARLHPHPHPLPGQGEGINQILAGQFHA
jgi:hypothetical protein